MIKRDMAIEIGTISPSKLRLGVGDRPEIKSNLQQIKTIRPRSINGSLMTKVSKPKLKLPSVLSVGGLQA